MDENGRHERKKGKKKHKINSKNKEEIKTKQERLHK